MLPAKNIIDKSQNDVFYQLCAKLGKALTANEHISKEIRDFIKGLITSGEKIYNINTLILNELYSLVIRIDTLNGLKEFAGSSICEKAINYLTSSQLLQQCDIQDLIKFCDQLLAPLLSETGEVKFHLNSQLVAQAYQLKFDTPIINSVATSSPNMIKSAEIVQTNIAQYQQSNITAEKATAKYNFPPPQQTQTMFNTQFSLPIYSTKPISYSQLFGSNATHLLRDMANHIFSYFNIYDLIHCARINKNWYSTVQLTISFPELFNALATSPANYKQNALVFENYSYTYLTLNTKINQLSHYLIDCCIKRQLPKESKVCVFLTPSDDAIIAMLAIMKAGLVYVPLNTDRDVAAEKLIQIMHDCRPALLLTHSHLLNHPLIAKISLSETQLLVLDKEQALLKQFPTSPPANKINARDAAYLLYTSGSTGASKGVLIEHEGLYNRFLSHKNLLKITANDRVALFASLGFDASIMEMMMALGSGAILYIVHQKIRLDILELGVFYKKNCITIAIFTPSMLRILDPKDFTPMRVIISTGEAIDEATFKRWYWIDEAKKIPRKFINGYGPVEATICTTLGVCTPETDLHIGKAVDGVEIFILEENFKDCSEENPEVPKTINRVKDGERGELYISGIGIARAYYGDDKRIRKLNNKRFFKIIHPDDHSKPPHQKRIVRVYRSGDAMRIHNGKLKFLERLDRQVKIYGKLVAPEEIDALLKKLPNIEDAYVDIYNDKYGNPIIDAYLLLKEQHQKPDLEVLYQSIAQTLTQTMCPSRWAIISKEQWAKSFNSSCKLDRQKLRQDISINFQRLQSDPLVLASDALEEELTQLWKQVLNIDDKEKFIYSINDNFRYLGGTSIQAANLIANINLKYPELKLTPANFFRNPTIISIARKIRRQIARQNVQINTAKYYYPVISLAEDRFPLKNHQIHTELPLFFIHSLLGNPLEDYGNIIEKWSSHRPIYAIQARGLQNAKDMDTTLEEIVLDYVQAITKIQPHGPYLLVGWSSGGVIASAISRYLKARGEQAAVLAIDSICPTIIQKMTKQQFAEYLLFIINKAILPRLKIKNLTYSANELSQFSPIKQLTTIVNECSNLGVAQKNYSEGLISTVYAILQSTLLYTSSLDEDNVTLLPTVASQNDYNEKLGWTKTVKILEPLKGDHFSILNEPLVLEELVKNIIQFADFNEQQFQVSKLKEQLRDQLKYYYQNHDMFIPRIFCKPLPLKDCFVNLTIVKKEQQEQAEQSKINFDLDRVNLYSCYEDIFSTDEKELILPEALFDERNKKIPKRIKIIGRAGIGKSTLTIFIAAYLWAAKNQWENKFNVVIKIMARNLSNKRYQQFPNIADIIQYECMDSSGATKKMSTEDILKVIQSNPEETLVVIDGWDEFNQTDSTCTKIIIDLLNNPKLNIVVLTRPFSDIDNKVKSFDLTLECIGFTSENIQTYLEKVCNDNNKVTLIMAFLKRNPAIHSLAHAPIILHMIYVIWDTDMANSTQPMTMTKLYEKIIVKLLEAYKLKQKEINPKLDITKKKNEAKNFLMLLAFRAMESNQIMLTYQFIQKIIKEYYHCDEEDVGDYITDLLTPGFLNTPDSDQINGRFYFPHLTIQEYFSAQFIVKLFISDNAHEKSKAKQFLQENKFNPRYQYVLLFIAGSLVEHKESLDEFFDALLQEPRDIIGVYEATIFAKCLDECQLSTKHRTRLLNFITNQIKIIYINNSKKMFKAHTKPESVKQFMEVLKICPYVTNSVEFITVIFELISKSIKEKNSYTTESIISYLGELNLNHSAITSRLNEIFFSSTFIHDKTTIAEQLCLLKTINPRIMENYLTLLESETECRKKQDIAERLYEMEKINGCIGQYLCQALKSNTFTTRVYAAKALKDHCEKDNQIITVLLECFDIDKLNSIAPEDEISRLILDCANALGHIKKLPDKVLPPLIKYMDMKTSRDNDNYIISWISRIISSFYRMDPEKYNDAFNLLISKLMFMLKTGEPILKMTAISELSSLNYLTDEIIEHLLSLLANAEFEEIVQIKDTLLEHNYYNNALIPRLLNIMPSKRWDEIHFIVEWLTELINQIPSRINIILDNLKIDDIQNSIYIAYVAVKCGCFNSKIKEIIIKGLTHIDNIIQCFSAYMIGESAIGDNDLINLLVNGVKKGNQHLRRFSAQSLGKIKNLDDTIIALLLQQAFREKKENARNACMTALNTIAKENKKLTSEIISILNTANHHDSLIAAEILKEMNLEPFLPEIHNIKLRYLDFSSSPVHCLIYLFERTHNRKYVEDYFERQLKNSEAVFIHQNKIYTHSKSELISTTILDTSTIDSIKTAANINYLLQQLHNNYTKETQMIIKDTKLTNEKKLTLLINFHNKVIEDNKHLLLHDSDFHRLIYHNLACNYFANKENTKADICFSKGIAIYESASILCEYGHFLYMYGNNLSAKLYLLRALASNCKEHKLSYGALEQHTVDNNLHTIIKHHKNAKFNCDSLCYYLLIRIYHRLNDIKELRKILKIFEKLATDSYDSISQLLLCFSYDYIGDFNKARQIFIEKFSNYSLYTSICKDAFGEERYNLLYNPNTLLITESVPPNETEQACSSDSDESEVDTDETKPWRGTCIIL